MGTIKKLYQDQLVGGSGSAGQEVYPVTSTLGVYDEDNTQLQDVLDKVTTNLGLFTCGTAAATAAKTVTASKFVLMEGGSIKIKFTYANSADSPTLAIGSTAAKPIMFNGSAASASNTWGAGDIVEFCYDGTNWVGSKVVPVSVSQNTLTIGGEDKGELAGQLIENPEWVKVVTDKDGRILYGVKTDGKLHILDELQLEGNVGNQISSIYITDSNEWLFVKIDKNNKIIEGIRKDGSKFFGGTIANNQLDERLNTLGNGISDLQNASAHFERVLIENGKHTHSTGYTYTSFGTGCTFRGLELYVQRCADNHFTDMNPKGKIVFYVRQDDGKFTHKFAPLDYNDVNYEYRDPRINITRGGDYLLLACFSADDNSVLNSYIWALNRQLNIVHNKTLLCPSTHIAWGNIVQTPTGHFLCACYKNDSNGVDLFRSSGTSAEDFGTFSNVAEIFASSASEPNESTLAYWGNKLICVGRQDNGNMIYAETSDLEGLTGWQTATLPMWGHCPCIQPYIDKKEPLIVAFGSSEYSAKYGYPAHGRSPYIRATFGRDELLSGNAEWTNIGIIDFVSGSYPTFVKNRFGYGCMYYEDIGLDHTHTNLWFKDVDIPRYLPDLAELQWRQNTIINL